MGFAPWGQTACAIAKRDMMGQVIRMIRRLSEYLGKVEHDWRKSFGHDITDPVQRKKSINLIRNGSRPMPPRVSRRF